MRRRKTRKKRKRKTRRKRKRRRKRRKNMRTSRKRRNIHRKGEIYSFKTFASRTVLVTLMCCCLALTSLLNFF